MSPTTNFLRSQSVRLAVACIECDAADVRRAALVDRGVAAACIAGLKHDTPALAAFVVRALRALVASSGQRGNGNERGLLRRLFDAHCVSQHLVGLYSSPGATEAGAAELRRDVHALLSALLLSPSSPLQTATPGAGGRGVVATALLKLQPRSDAEQRELLLATLARHPWAMNHFLSSFKFRLEPPSTKAGSDTTPLGYLHDVSLLVQTLGTAAATREAHAHLVAPPHGVGRTVLSRALQSDNALVRFASAAALIALLRLHRVLRATRGAAAARALDQSFLLRLPGLQVVIKAAKREQSALSGGAAKAEVSADGECIFNVRVTFLFANPAHNFSI